MFILSRVFNLFRASADADLSEEASFKTAFSNVVNILMLGQSLMLGLISLIREDPVLSSINLVFSLFFITYFVVTYIVRVDRYVSFLDRVAIFFYFIIIYVTCAHYNVIGLTMTIYPFIAIILHGRHVGSILSVIQAAIVLAYYFVAVHLFGAKVSAIFTLSGTITIVVVQLISIFIFYVAVRWLSSLVYEKNREVAMLYEEQATQRDLIGRLSTCVEKPLRDISEASAILVTERLTPMQSDLCSIVRSSALNAINNVNAVRKASSLNIPIVPAERVRFNLYNLMGGMLKLYRSKDPQKLHSFTLAGGVPEEVRGNSILTRQVILNVLDAFDRCAGLTSSGLKIVVCRENVLTRGVVLHFSMTLEYNLEFDRREISVSEGNLIEFLGLGVTRRIVESEGGYFNAVSEGGGVMVEFTLKYSSLDDGDDLEPDLIRNARAALSANIPMTEASALVMTASDALWDKIEAALGGYCAKLIRARTASEAVRLFANNKVDVVLTDLSSDGGAGAKLVGMVRDAESGMVRKVPVLDIVDPDSPEQMSASVHSCFDLSLPLPFDASMTRDAMRSFFV